MIEFIALDAQQPSRLEALNLVGGRPTGHPQPVRPSSPQQARGLVCQSERRATACAVRQATACAVRQLTICAYTEEINS